MFESWKLSAMEKTGQKVTNLPEELQATALKRGWRIVRMFGDQQLMRKRNRQFFWDPKQKKASYWHQISVKI